MFKHNSQKKIKIFQSDGGTEFVNRYVRRLLEENGTLHCLSCPYTPQQNGRVERKHRHVVETELAMLFNGHVPPAYWVDAFSSSIYIINQLPTPVLDGKSTFDVLFSRQPTYGNFRTFTCRVFPYLWDYATDKLTPRSIPCVFMGYSSQYKGYRCLDPTTSHIYITRYARFDESTYPFVGTNSITDFNNLPLGSFMTDFPFISPNTAPPVVSKSAPPSPSLGCGYCNNAMPPPNEPTSPSPLPTSEPTSPTSQSTLLPSDGPSSPIPMAAHVPPLSPSHSMTPREKAGIFKPKHRADLAFTNITPLYSAFFTASDPKSFKTAAKSVHWMEAMRQEINALHNNHTWTLVPRPAIHNVIGSKWLCRTKHLFDGSIDWHKPRLVVQRFSQTYGLDYSHTFSHVVKATTVRIVLSLVAIHGWKLHQLDVNNSFLHGQLNELVYMEQPSGFVDSRFPNYVCRLNKALYGLKQAPRAWFQRLSNFLL